MTEALIWLVVEPEPTLAMSVSFDAPVALIPAGEGVQGPPGPPTPPSADPGNRSTSGSDGGLYTPDLIADPLAYYILAKA